MNFDQAQDAAAQEAGEFIGVRSVSKIVSLDYGGSIIDDELCKTLAEIAADQVEPLSESSYEFDDEEEGDGQNILRFYNVDGLKFVEEQMDEGGPAGSGNTCYVSLNT